MEAQGIAGKLDFRGRKRGLEQAADARKQAPVADAAPAKAPAAKKRRVAKQPTMKQALAAARAAAAAEARGGDGIAAPLSGRAAVEAGAPADAAHARAGGVDAELGSAGAVEAPQTQPLEAEACAAPRGLHASARAAPLAAALAAVTAGAVTFELEALETSDDEDDEEDGAEPSALAEMEARVAALKRAMAGCERVRLASTPGSAKALRAAQQRDALGREIAALACIFSPEGMSDEEECADAPAVAAAAR